MIEAHHRPWAIALYNIYIRRLLKKSFHALHLFGTVPAVADQQPLLFLPNHNTWWDGFLVDAFNNHAYRRKIYLMMLEEQLAKYRFFSSVGAYGFRPGDSADVRRVLRYTAGIMEQEQGNAVIALFAQGELVPFGAPQPFQPGYELAVKMYGKPVTLLPLAMRIETKRDQRPEAFFLPGTPIEVEDGNTLPAHDLEYLHLELQKDLVERIQHDAPSKIIFHGKNSMHKTFDTVTGQT